MSVKTREQTIQEKALDVNLDTKFYGTFAEIGAGQEVARQFFQAGRASQTIALTISAYDMTYSDLIYGKEKSGRYVCLPRLGKMLEREYTKLLERLASTRKDTAFFSFADTVATSSEGSKKTCHGWMGVRFQLEPDGTFNEIKLHVRMLDRLRLQQQETLSKLGVNLLHSCFYKTKNQNEFLDGLFDQIKTGSVAVDVVYFVGDAFKKFNENFFNLMLVEKKWSQACLIDAEGKVQNPQDYLWGKSLLIQRGFFEPVTNTHLDIFSRGLEHFKKEFSLKAGEIMGLFEFTIDNRAKGTRITTEQAFNRVEMISKLEIPVLVTQFTLFYQLKEFIRNSTKKPLGIVIGATHLDKLFDESFYFDLSGGLLEGMGKLLGRFTRLYIYPHKTSEICLLTKSFFPKPNVKNIYRHFIDNNMIQDIAGCDDLLEFIHSEQVNKLIKKKDKSWKKLVPEKIHKLIEKQL
ncbi:MAG: hypothetical protein H7328_02780 [Bdellovibrio sp.]|nr:hypothetical protein [Bdellovibrio sp.]